MKIKNWEHAIDLTIERHQVALNEGVGFGVIKEVLCQKDWMHNCPLCEYTKKYTKNCYDCLWKKFKGADCFDVTYYDFQRDEESIKRLTNWKELLTYLDAYPEMFKQEA